ncbi:MAG: hypothetical protein LM522_06190 [Candidatus Contendobacter sp.]|nr:hypothetical protein [Candidatus Contendobacter sp.]
MKATHTEPGRDLAASVHERTVGSRLELAAWQAAHPRFTSAELLAQWGRIREAWGLSKPDPLHRYPMPAPCRPANPPPCDEPVVYRVETMK